MSTLLETTAFVLALPTEMEQQSTVYPKYAETLAIKNAKTSDLIKLHQIYYSMKQY